MATRDFDTCIEQCAKGDQDEEEDDDEWYLNADDEQPGLDIDDLKKSSNGLNTTPFNWQCQQGQFDMHLISGFAGATITQDEFIKVQMGWAVAEKAKKENN